jgi:tetratricopeptide (TPR) repeat protein
VEKSPNARYQTAKAMAEDLNRFMSDATIVARPQGPLRRLVKFARRRRLELVAALSSILLLGAVLLGLRFRQDAWEARRGALMQEGADAHWKTHDSDAAEQKFQKVLASEPDYYGALYCLAIVQIDRYYREGNRELLLKAEDFLHRAVRVKPSDPGAFNGLGVLHQAANRPIEAIKAYEEARRLDPDYYPVYVNLAMLYATQGRMQEAEEYAAKGVDLLNDEREVMPWRILAAIQLHLQRPSTYDTLVNARKISEADVPTIVLTAIYHLGQVGANNTETALELAATADSLIRTPWTAAEIGRPDQIRARVKRTLASAALRGQKWDRARQAAGDALAAGDSPSSYAHFIMAISQAHLGDLASAREHLRDGKTLWPQSLREQSFVANEDGKTVWFDTAADLEALQAEALLLVGDAQTTP